MVFNTSNWNNCRHICFFVHNYNNNCGYNDSLFYTTKTTRYDCLILYWNNKIERNFPSSTEIIFIHNWVKQVDFFLQCEFWSWKDHSLSTFFDEYFEHSFMIKILSSVMYRIMKLEIDWEKKKLYWFWYLISRYFILKHHYYHL
jgi:hypothetical protein